MCQTLNLNCYTITILIHLIMTKQSRVLHIHLRWNQNDLSIRWREKKKERKICDFFSSIHREIKCVENAVDFIFDVKTIALIAIEIPPYISPIMIKKFKIYTDFECEPFQLVIQSIDHNRYWWSRQVCKHHFSWIHQTLDYNFIPVILSCFRQSLLSHFYL